MVDKIRTLFLARKKVMNRVRWLKENFTFLSSPSRLICQKPAHSQSSLVVDDTENFWREWYEQKILVQYSQTLALFKDFCNTHIADPRVSFCHCRRSETDNHGTHPGKGANAILACRRTHSAKLALNGVLQYITAIEIRFDLDKCAVSRTEKAMDDVEVLYRVMANFSLLLECVPVTTHFKGGPKLQCIMAGTNTDWGRIILALHPGCTR
ncbi:hypothetical protein CBL_04857 [Carabus blaptoides fortunei]